MMSSQINLEAYRGQGEDAQKWFTYFERWTTFMNYNEERAALALPFHLKGIAKTWYDSLSQTTQRSLDLLKTAFINRFKPTQTVDISVLTITQKHDESADEYFSRFIDSSYIRDIPEPLQISILMKGLRPSLLTLVMPKNPQSMEEMRMAMALAEQTANASARHVNVVSGEDKLHEELQFLRNQLSEVLALQSASQQPAGQTLPQPPHNWPPPQPHHQQYPQWTNNAMHRPNQHYQQRRQPVNYNQHQQSNWTCNFCGDKEYHIRNNCPAVNRRCLKCKKIGHFASECQSSRRNQNARSHVR